MEENTRRNNKRGGPLPKRGPRKTRKHTSKRKKDKVRRDLDNDDFDSRHYGQRDPQQVDTTNPTLVVEPVVSPNVFEGVAVWLVNDFIMRGGQEVSGSEDTPYHARIYLTETLSTAAQGGEPLLQRAPRVFGIIAALLTRKSVRMYNGNISFNFNVDGSVNVSEFVQTGPSGAVSKINYGKKSPTDIVNVNIPLSTSPSTYTAELGLKAVQFIFDYLEKAHASPEFRQEPFPLTEDRWTHDPSAFAFAKDVLGGGNYNVGGQFCTVALECNIPTVAASVFVPFNATVNKGRSTKYSYPTVGDANFMTGMFSTKMVEDEYASKRHPTLKYIDFYEILDIVARTIMGGQQKAVDDESYPVQYANNSNYYLDKLEFPVTFQTLALVLRNLCMKVDPDSQLTGMTVHPVAEVGNANVFRPFVTGAGQGPYTGGTPLKLPVALMEKLAGLCGKTMNPDEWGNTPLNWVPVWGIYSQDKFDVTQFRVTEIVNETTTIFESFPTDVTESFIDIVDGTTGNRLAWINDASFLTSATVLINKWFKDNAEYFIPQSELSPDGGIGILSTIAETNNVIDFIEREDIPVVPKKIFIADEDSMTVEQAAKIRAMIEKKMEKPKRMVGIAQNFYNGRKRIAVTMFDKPMASVAVGMGQYAIRPTNNLTNVVNETDNNTIQTMQGNTREYFIATEAQGVTRFADLGEEHQEIANLCIRNKYGPEDIDVALYKKAAEEGEGGMIGDLLKGAGQVATGVGSSLVNGAIGVAVDRYKL